MWLSLKEGHSSNRHLATESHLPPKPYWLKTKSLAHLSPYILCLFLLGLPPGVISLVRPVSSNSFISALLSAFGSTAASIVFDLSLRAPLSTFALLPMRRFSVAAGGVIAPGGVWTGGVLRWVVFLNRLTCEFVELGTSSAAPISAMIEV